MDECTYATCDREAAQAIYWPALGGERAWVGGYCTEHAAELLATVPGARYASGTAIKPTLDTDAQAPTAGAD